MQPDDSIGYWLSYAQRCFSPAFSEVLRTHCVEQGKAYVITPSQWGILSFIAHKQEQTIGALAQRLGVDASAVTNIAQWLALFTHIGTRTWRGLQLMSPSCVLEVSRYIVLFARATRKDPSYATCHSHQSL